FVEAGPGVFELVCTSGAQGKCVRFGYHPWESAPDGRPMRDYFDACVRMLRAEYCGDGHGWTRDGTFVDIWDDHGIRKTDATRTPEMSNTAPVENAQPSDASHAAIAASSSTRTKRPFGIFDSMKSMCCCVS